MSRFPVNFRCVRLFLRVLPLVLVVASFALGAGCGAAPAVAGSTPETIPERTTTSQPTTTEPAAPEPHARRYEDCPAIACGGCQGGYATEPDGCPSCRCLFESPAVHVAPGPEPQR